MRRRVPTPGAKTTVAGASRRRPYQSYLRSRSGANGPVGVEPRGVDRLDPDTGARVLRVHHLAVADVHADVRAAVVLDQVARLHRVERDLREGGDLRRHVVRHADTGGTPSSHRQTRAVEGV